MTDTIPLEIVEAARAAGIHDPADLQVFDLSVLPRDAAGRYQNAAAIVEQFRQAKPHMFKAQPALKNAREMSKSEVDAALRDMARKEDQRREAIIMDRKLAELAKRYPNAKPRA